MALLASLERTLVSWSEPLQRKNFFLRWVQTVLQAPAEPWRIDLDGRRVEGRFLGVVAMNVRELGPNIALAPAADSRIPKAR